jgi:hypothetical protein
VAAQDDRPSALFGSSPQSILTPLTNLERRLRTFPAPEMPIAAPFPSRTGWVQQMVDDMLASADLPHSRVDEPPELQRFTREPLEPVERGSRLRSPIVTHQDLPLRIDTEPPPKKGMLDGYARAPKSLSANSAKNTRRHHQKEHRHQLLYTEHRSQPLLFPCHLLSPRNLRLVRRAMALI